MYLLARSVPVRLLLRARDALRVESRDAGGAYSLGGRGGYGSMMRTSWTLDVPNPGVQPDTL